MTAPRPGARVGGVKEWACVPTELSLWRLRDPYTSTAWTRCSRIEHKSRPALHERGCLREPALSSALQQTSANRQAPGPAGIELRPRLATLLPGRRTSSF